MVTELRPAGVFAAKHREFVYIGEPIPKIDRDKDADFLLHVQKSMLLSLAERGLLNDSQMERCIDEILRRHGGKKKQRPG